jgi:hypothetical protein
LLVQQLGKKLHTHSSHAQPSQPGPGSGVQPSVVHVPQSSAQLLQSSIASSQNASPQKLPQNPQSSAHRSQLSLPLHCPSPQLGVSHSPHAEHASLQQSPMS